MFHLTLQDAVRYSIEQLYCKFLAPLTSGYQTLQYFPVSSKRYFSHVSLYPFLWTLPLALWPISLASTLKPFSLTPISSAEPELQSRDLTLTSRVFSGYPRFPHHNGTHSSTCRTPLITVLFTEGSSRINIPCSISKLMHASCRFSPRPTRRAHFARSPFSFCSWNKSLLPFNNHCVLVVMLHDCNMTFMLFWFYHFINLTMPLILSFVNESFSMRVTWINRNQSKSNAIC